MKLLANSSYGYQIMHRSRHSVTKFLNNEKTQSAISSKMLNRVYHITDQMYEVELVKPEIENREPIRAGFFILKNAKQRTLELYFNFFEKLCDADNFEELEMDTDSLYLTLWEENFEGLILSQKPVECNAFERFHRKFHFQRNRHFFPGCASTDIRNMIRGNRAIRARI